MRLIEAQSHVTRNGANIGQFKDSANLAVFGIVHFSQIHCIRRIHSALCKVVGQPRPDNYETDVCPIEVAKYFDEVVDFFSVLLFTNSPSEQDDFLEGNPQLLLDRLFRFRNLGEIFEIYRIVRDEDFAMVSFSNEATKRGGVENEAVADLVKVVKEEVSNAVVRIVEISRLRPKRNSGFRKA